MTKKLKLPPPVIDLKVENGWTDRSNDLVELLDGVDTSDAAIEDLVGAQAIKEDDKIAMPAVFEYSHKTRRTSYRRGQMIVDDVPVEDGAWIEVDPRMTLKRAFQLYGVDNVYAYEKIVVETKLEIVVMPVREKKKQSLRILVRRPPAAA